MTRKSPPSHSLSLFPKESYTIERRVPLKDVKKEEFNTQFAAMYCNTEKKAKAEAALHTLKQTKLVVAHYTHQCNLQAHNAGWEAPTLVSQYKHGLKTQIRVVLLMAWTEFMDVSEVANLALKIDNELNGIAPAETSSTPDPNAMDLLVLRGRLLEAEKTKMMRAGQCFRCGGQGHRVRECLDRDSKGKGKEQTQIAELEEEIKQLKGGSSSSPETDTVSAMYHYVSEPQ
ncbi:hypothetical protein PGT21_019082 [Puccinia graminis f. sp. tritici]|uniref:CCHC-type domain-containing protein n=1 Tax=Puccinia graminis f. sp. tritici TaxID=56615 RepID=A0A5B0PXX8_PUCGR|nr:hypothetical protein PGT21_019082 [Puccinia graminis f. sp. tritici]KAA1135134.1 hypothetical protein PGTUg99_019373 [Puccinia graminis f. sp. tritici]